MPPSRAKQCLDWTNTVIFTKMNFVFKYLPMLTMVITTTNVPVPPPFSSGITSAEILLCVHDIPRSDQPGYLHFETDEEKKKSGLEFIFFLEGSLEVSMTGKHGFSTLQNISPMANIISYLPDCRGRMTVPSSTRLRAVSIEIDPRYLNTVFGREDCLRSAAMPGLAAVAAGEKRPFFAVRELALPLQFLAREVADRYAASIPGDVFIESKKLELLHKQCETLGLQSSARTDVSREELAAVAKARALLLENLSSPPPLPELAASVGVSKARLNAAFRAVYEDTVYGVIRKERLECARKMLESGVMNVTEIAYECGYSSPSHLTKAFTGCFGIRPKQYQKEHALSRQAGQSPATLAV